METESTALVSTILQGLPSGIGALQPASFLMAHTLRTTSSVSSSLRSPDSGVHGYSSCKAKKTIKTQFSLSLCALTRSLGKLGTTLYPRVMSMLRQLTLLKWHTLTRGNSRGFCGSRELYNKGKVSAMFSSVFLQSMETRPCEGLSLLQAEQDVLDLVKGVQ